MPELLERREADFRKQKAAAKRQAQLSNIIPSGRYLYLSTPPTHQQHKDPYFATEYSFCLRLSSPFPIFGARHIAPVIVQLSPPDRNNHTHLLHSAHLLGE